MNFKRQINPHYSPKNLIVFKAKSKWPAEWYGGKKK